LTRKKRKKEKANEFKESDGRRWISDDRREKKNSTSTSTSATTIKKLFFSLQYVERELVNHSNFCHPHVIQFKEAFLTRSHLGIAMEYAPGGVSVVLLLVVCFFFFFRERKRERRKKGKKN
jgi:hypothetical protein